ncbi:MAG: ribonuclease P protein component [Gammaproteobacteria bacterium]
MTVAAGSAIDARLRRDYRLSNKGDFTRIFRRSQRSADALFVVLASRGSHDHARLGMAISMKATGSAVCRNRIKRLVRESFRLRRADMPALDFVVMAKPGVARESTARIAASLDAHWSRIVRLCAASSSS